MIGLIRSILVLIAITAAVPPESGRVVWYADGVMRQVIDNRLEGRADPLPSPIPDWVRGYVAHWDCENLGQPAYLHIDGYGWLGPLMVADCTAASDLEIVRDRHIVAELEWSLAEQVPGLVENGWASATTYIVPRGELSWYFWTTELINSSTAPQRCLPTTRSALHTTRSAIR